MPERLNGWARMLFKPEKSRCLVLKKSRIVDTFLFIISETPILTISEKLVKSMGNIYDSSHRVTTFMKNNCEELKRWLKDVDKGLPGNFKAWISQHSLLPKIIVPL